MLTLFSPFSKECSNVYPRVNVYIDILIAGVASFFFKGGTTMQKDILNIEDAISIYKVTDLIADSTSITGAEVRLLSAEIEKIEEQIISLRAKLKKETQFNRKMELNIEIKRLEQDKNKLTGGDRL